jgi:hypothetical protein
MYSTPWSASAAITISAPVISLIALSFALSRILYPQSDILVRVIKKGLEGP